MKYSIIITYRDREKHLSQLLPVLQEKFKDKDYEIIISEQDDKKKFRKNDLYNIAVRDYSTGDILIFHDVDCVPNNEVTYELDNEKVMYPCRRAIFLNEDGKFKELDEIPLGYRGFRNDVGDHSGFVFMMTREIWEEIGGLNPLYVGWGLEDDDTRQRVRAYGHEWYRPQPEVGTFFVLPHDDNHPGTKDESYLKNVEVAKNFMENLKYGYKDSKGSVSKFETDIDNLTWLKIK
tara:strand:+ start:1555 stop:2256 length:702 start_codon:yes stop_codon:yes gene_type:complete